MRCLVAYLFVWPRLSHNRPDGGSDRIFRMTNTRKTTYILKCGVREAHSSRVNMMFRHAQNTQDYSLGLYWARAPTSNRPRFFARETTSSTHGTSGWTDCGSAAAGIRAVSGRAAGTYPSRQPTRQASQQARVALRLGVSMCRATPAHNAHTRPLARGRGLQVGLWRE